jgi:starch synthase
MEFAPIAKAGGLGEVVVGLSRELTRVQEEVEVILPKYDFISPLWLKDLQLEIPEFLSFEGGNEFSNAMWSAEAEGCQLHLLEAHHPSNYFNRGKIYGCEDDVPRFLYFSRAVVEYLKKKKEPIDILHLHDWHVAAIAPMVRDLCASELDVKAIVLSIHNADYQGKCAPHDLDAVGLLGDSYLTPDKLQDNDPRQPGTINLLKGGIVYADAVVAVSPTYAQEILTPFHGSGLESTLQKHKHKVSGILNGLDLQLWDPTNSKYLTATYGPADSIAKIQAAKRKNQQSIETRFGLKGKGRPWVGAVTRLVPQKGPGLIEEALHQAVKQGALFALLGSSPIPELQHHFEELREKYKGHEQVLIHLSYDESLAHQLFASLDFHLVPSLFEPCGLTQMIAMHYGTIPIVRATGGLKDTVFDIDHSPLPPEKRNGFVFDAPTPLALSQTLERALHLWHTKPTTYHSVLQHDMQIDFSWKKPAQQYLKLFRKLLEN